MVEARKQGYEIEAIVFRADHPQVNYANVETRNAKGGIYLRPGVVFEQHLEIEFFNQVLRLDPHYRAPRISHLSPIKESFLFELATQEGTFSEILQRLEEEQRTLIQQYISEDIFNRIEFVRVQDWSKTQPSN